MHNSPSDSSPLMGELSSIVDVLFCVVFRFMDQCSMRDAI